jgi:hypothetical protein
MNDPPRRRFMRRWKVIEHDESYEFRTLRAYRWLPFTLKMRQSVNCRRVVCQKTRPGA